MDFISGIRILSLILASDNYQEIEAQKTPRVSKDGTER